MASTTSEIPEVRPASTVVLVRDSDRGMETLMLRRNKALVFAGGLWVFPGGSLDPEDFAAAGDDIERAARIGAAREAREEAGLAPRPEEMVLLSHWTTPVGEQRRFSTWIFAAPLAADEDVVIDGGEIHDAQWLPVQEAVTLHEAGELGLLPPTYVTLCNLARHECVAAMVEHERNSPVPEVLPIIVAQGEQMVVKFRGDAEYDGDGRGAPGAVHRAALHDRTWRYTYKGVDPLFPPLIEV